MPFANPKLEPKAKAANTENVIPEPLERDKAHSMPLAASIEPTERSIPAVRIIKNCPMARIPMIELCKSKLNILLGLIKMPLERMVEIIIILSIINQRLYFMTKLFAASLFFNEANGIPIVLVTPFFSFIDYLLRLK